MPPNIPLPSGEARERRAFLWQAGVVFLVALTMRIMHVWQIRSAPFFTVLMGDARGYDDWAQKIAGGEWLGHEVFYQAPLYPYFLGILYAFAGRDLWIVRLCQAVIGSAACALLGIAAARVFSQGAGLIAGLAMALYAPAIFFDGLIQKSVLDVFFVCLSMWLLSRLLDAPADRMTLLSLGLAMGGLSLTRENALVFVPVVLFWTLTRRGSLTAAGTVLLGVALTLIPVAVRNYAVGGGLYLTTSQFGPNFFIGNNPTSDGSYMSLRFGRGAPEYERQDATRLAEHATGRSLTPAEVSSYWTGRALTFITSEPAAWLALLGKKLALLLNAVEAVDTESLESYSEWSAVLRLGAPLGHFGILMPLAVAGLCLTWRERNRLWVFYGITLAYSASVLLFYVFARYRFPLVPLLLLFASGGLAAAPSFFRNAGFRQKTSLACALIAIAVFSNWRILPGSLMRAITENNLAAALQQESRLEEAAAHYRRAIEIQPGYAPAYNNLGTALRAAGQVDQAIATYERALAVRPDFPDAHYNLANALLEKNRPVEAVLHYRVALASIPGSSDAHNNLGIALAAEGQLVEAVEEFRHALRGEPESAAIHRNLGDALASLGRVDEAIDYFRGAIRLAPNDAGSQYDLGSTLLEAGRLPEAVDAFRATLALQPDMAEAHNNLGIALASLGDIESSISHFQQALKLRPNYEDARRNLSMAQAVRHSRQR
jgi:tetratricopeptide (TPR) repeat protein